MTKLSDLGFADLVAMREHAHKQIAAVKMTRHTGDDAITRARGLIAHFNRIAELAGTEINRRLENVQP